MRWRWELALRLLRWWLGLRSRADLDPRLAVARATHRITATV